MRKRGEAGTERRVERERVGRLLVSSYSRPTGGDGTLAMVFGTAFPQFTRHERLVVPDVNALSF